MNRYIKYIGLDFKKYDCFNLVKLIYKQEYDKYILSTDVKHNQSDLINQCYLGEVDNWLEVKTPLEGDIVAIRLDSNYSHLVTHFGVMINDKQMIHSIEKCGVVVENITKYYKLVAGFYRHKDLI